MRPPRVFHPVCSAPLPGSTRILMAQFQLLHELLLRQGLALAGQVHQPLPVHRRALELVHPRNHHEAFSRDQLTPAAQRRIGLRLPDRRQRLLPLQRRGGGGPASPG
ncbi:MAG: hypothetical protein VKI83_07290 [Synechococcaceae cyanobacterium]|nr:hypothetical protein [Synechococcaceae cyanobacterium]